MTENLQVDVPQSPQAVFVRCCLKIDETNADVYGDGELSVSDALFVQQIIRLEDNAVRRLYGCRSFYNVGV